MLKRLPLIDPELDKWIESLTDGKPEGCVYLCPVCRRMYRKEKVLERHQRRYH